MQTLPFLYSNEPVWRTLRHLCFWLAWFAFQLLLYSFSPSPVLQQQPFLQRLIITLPETLIFMIPGAFLAYTLMYFVIPKLVLPGKYLLATIGIIGLILLTACMSAILSMTVVDYLRHQHADNISEIIAGERHPPLFVQFGLAMLAGLRGSVTVGGIAAAIKLMKCFNEEKEAALVLEKEKVHAELQLLKAQLHPHFLFNTLNNIYSFTQEVSEKASGMILGLSQLLRYILYECNKPFVPLEKELKLIRDYLALETIRYEQHLEIAVQFPPAGSAVIAPLLLLPFVENAFKHGASQMTENPWISLDVELHKQEFRMRLINGKPSVQNKTTPGIGILNVRKRLELIYPDRHELLIDEQEEMYIVNLRIHLDTVPSQVQIPENPGAREKI